MKTSKKLLSLLLVAMLLVSAIPFQASAISAIVSCPVTIDGYLVGNLTDEDGIITAAELYDYLELSVGEEPAIDAQVAALFPWDTAVRGTAITLTTTSAPSTPPATEPPATEAPTTEPPVVEIVPPATEAPTAATEAPTTEPPVIEIVPPATEAPTTEPPVVEIVPPATEAPTAPPATEPPATAPSGPVYYTVTIDYTEGSEGMPARQYEMVEGQIFDSRLPANPQRNGMTFSHWYYAANGQVVKPTDAFNPANGTVIKAKWNIASFFLTLDENRQGEEYVNYGVTVSLGEAIYGKVAKFQPERKGYIFMGWYLNGKLITPETIYNLPDHATAYAKWELASDVPGRPVPPEKDGKVYLEIHLRTRKGLELSKRLDVTEYGADNLITRAEVEKIVKKQGYTARTGHKLGYDGLFDEESWFYYTRDPETNGDESIVVNLWDDQYIFVVVKNVRVSNADTSNPKTGDMILPVSVVMMASSGIAAAAAYITGKKRK